MKPAINVSSGGQMPPFMFKMTNIIIEKQENRQSISINADQQFQSLSNEIVNIIKEVNKDAPEKRNMSTIDKLSRVENMELIGVLELDSLVEFGFLPEEFSRFTTKFLRLKISEDGKGREEIKDIVIGHSSKKEEKGFMNKLFGNRQKDQQNQQQQQNINNGGV